MGGGITSGNRTSFLAMRGPHGEPAVVVCADVVGYGLIPSEDFSKHIIKWNLVYR